MLPELTGSDLLDQNVWAGVPDAGAGCPGIPSGKVGWSSCVPALRFALYRSFVELQDLCQGAC